jgi:DNA-directed RNA polymerase subunit RPC12/RpoP
MAMVRVCYVCPRCGREAHGWPVYRGDRCSPARWVYCIRDPKPGWMVEREL